MSQESRVSFEESSENDLVSTELCLFDKTWSCGSSRKMEMEQNDTGSNDLVTLAARNDESTEQTRKMEDDTDSDKIGSNDLVALDARNEESTAQTRKIKDDTDRFIIQKTLQHFRLSKFDFNPFLVEYLSEDDQDKIRKGCGIRVNMYDEESQTMHEGLMRQTKKDFKISGTWLRDFAHMRGLQVGDKIRLYWDYSGYTFRFRVLSRAPAQVKTSTAEVISENEETRKMEDDDMDSEQDQVGLSVVLQKHDISRNLLLSRTDFNAYILRYLTEDDQNKIRLGYGIKVNMYDDETQTTHKEVLMRQCKSRKNNYFLTGTWLAYFVERRGLQVGDKIGLSWDCSRYMLHFRVLSHATAEVISR